MRLYQTLFLGLAVCLPHQSHSQEHRDYPIKSVPFTNVHIKSGFWRSRQDTNSAATVHHTLAQCDLTGRINNFAKAAGMMKGNFEGWWFNDSDVYKAIEGASYSLMIHPDSQLEKYLDGLIDTIATAQEPDGYLYSPRKTISSDYKYAEQVGKERWSNLASSHELYDQGHLYEAAVAYYQATGKKSLLNVALKSADLVARVFGPGKSRYVPGHQEIEIGLVKLYRLTGNEKYLKLAKFFLDERGHSDGHTLYGTYSQDHKPVIDQDEAVGHSVRALYMYSGMADVVALFGDQAYSKALDKVWADVYGKKVYLTGGIGAAGGHEGFADPYELPNLSAYCETCASIASVLWNYRMFLLYGDSKYIDVLERTLYNGMISGVALDGRTFFYTNPLESDGQHERKPWYAVACCPPNIARIMPQIPGMTYASEKNQLYINLFIASSTTVPMGDQTITIKQETQYPWQGDVNLTIEPEQSGKEFTMSIRIPGWARNQPMPTDLYRFMDTISQQATIAINGKSIKYDVNKGYAEIRQTWNKGDVVSINFPMPVRRVLSHENVKDDIGKVALQRGPIVYCVEWPDIRSGKVTSLVLPDSENITVRNEPDLLGGVSVLQGSAMSLRCVNNQTKTEATNFTAIPYYAWGNRGRGDMAVWLARNESTARPIPCQ